MEVMIDAFLCGKYVGVQKVLKTVASSLYIIK